MKSLLPSLQNLVPLLLLLGITSCLNKDCDLSVKYLEYQPVYMEQEAFESVVAVEEPQTIFRPGKIHVSDSALFINDIARGLHIFDNTQPENPRKVAFINIPGSYDVSVICDKLYVDSSSDILIFDISELSNPILINRLKGVLQSIVSYRGYNSDPSQGVVVDWVAYEAEIDFGCPYLIPEVIIKNTLDVNNPTSSKEINEQGIVPTRKQLNGKANRFISVGQYLYVPQSFTLGIYDLMNCSAPTEANILAYAGNFENPEDIISYQNYLFIRDRDRNAVYSLDDLLQPSLEYENYYYFFNKSFIYDGNYSYAVSSNSVFNTLEVYNTTDFSNPIKFRNYEMVSPKSLSLDRNLLFVADGGDGVKIYDASNPEFVGDRLIAQFIPFPVFQVIAKNGRMTIIGINQFAQYDYSDSNDIRLLSISVIN